MQLEPPSGYWCDLHSMDLTELVRAELTPKRDVVGVVATLQVFLRRQGPREHFTVVVKCPGTAVGTAHPLQFVGYAKVLR